MLNPLLYESLDNDSLMASVRKGDPLFILLPHEVIKARFVRATQCFVTYTFEDKGDMEGKAKIEIGEGTKMGRVKKRFCFVEKTT